MVTTSSPPLKTQQSIFNPFSHHLQLQKSSNRPKLQKSLHQIFMRSFPLSPFFHPLKNTTRFVWGENAFNPPFWGPSVSQALHYAAYHGHLSCVTELMKSNPRKVPAFQKPPRRWIAAGRFFIATFFFFCSKLFFESSEVSKWECFWVPGSCFWFIVFDWYLLIEFEYGSLLLMGGVWKLQTRLSMRFPFGGWVLYFFVIVSYFVPPPSYSLRKKMTFLMPSEVT